MDNSTSPSMDSAVSSSTPPFDPFQQNLTLYLGDGTSVNVSIPQIDMFILYGTQISINYGAQIGASIVLFIVMLLLTRPDKRTSVVFLMNTVSLMLNIVRNVLLCLFFTSAFNESYAYFAGDYSRVPQSDYATSVTGAVFELLTLISIEISLCLQVRVVCVTLQQMHRMMIFCLSVIIALMAIGLRFAYMVKNSIFIMKTIPLDSLYQLGSVTNITTSISICWFSLVFVTKLGVALRTRSKLGMGQFGSMQIIFIMGCQTLIIPAIFSILQYVVDNPAMSSEVITAVVIFLPLSSLWASASIENRTQDSKEKNFGSNPFSSNTSGSSRMPVMKKEVSGSLASPSNTATTIRMSESTTPSPRRFDERAIYKDIEAQDLVR